jgi:hypothetical protein
MSLVTITVTTRRGEDSCFDLSVEWDRAEDGGRTEYSRPALKMEDLL